MRNSPDVRTTRSGSLSSGWYSRARRAFSSTLDSRHAVGDQPFHRVDDLGAPAVVERDVERHRRVVPGEPGGPVHLAQHAARDPPVAPPRERDAHALGVQLVGAPLEQPPVEVHEVAHLVDRPAPVLGGERVDGQGPHPGGERAVGGVEQRLLARGVALGARQALALGPSAVAVHDDGHVARDRRRVNRRRQGHRTRIGHVENLLRCSRRESSRGAPKVVACAPSTPTRRTPTSSPTRTRARARR